MSTFLKYDKVKDSTTGKVLPEIIEDVKNSISPSTPNDFGIVGKVYSDKVVVPPKGYRNTPFVVIKGGGNYWFCTGIIAANIYLYGLWEHEASTPESTDFSHCTLSTTEGSALEFSSITHAICSDAYGEQLLLENGVSTDKIEVLAPKTITDFGIVPPKILDDKDFAIGYMQSRNTTYIVSGITNVLSDGAVKGSEIYGHGGQSLDFSNDNKANLSEVAFSSHINFRTYCNSVGMYKQLFEVFKNTLILIQQNTVHVGSDVYIQQILGGTTEALNKYVGKDRQLAINLDDYTLRVMDGKTPGGHLISGSGSAEIPQEVLDRIASLEAMDLTNKAAITKNTEDIEAANTILTDVTFKEV